MLRRFILIAFFICFGLWLLSDYLVLSIFSVAASRVRHASIEVVAYDSGGRHLDSSEFMRTWFPNLIVRGNDGYAGLGFQYGVFRPRIAIPAGENVTFDILWPVPGFGKVLLTADNRGRGYKVSAGAYTRIELVPELARSRVEQIQRWIAEHNDGRFSSDSVGDDLSHARSLL